MQIAVLNNTRMEPITFGDFTSWITNAFSFFKEWAGMFAGGGPLSSWDVEYVYGSFAVYNKSMPDTKRLFTRLRSPLKVALLPTYGWPL